MRRGHHGKVDANQRVIVAALRKAGCRVLSLAEVGHGCPDLLIESPRYGLMLLEVKRLHGTMTKDQVTFQQLGWPVYVARSVQEALEVIR